MIRSLATTLASLALLSPIVGAQSITSPRGFGALEGDSSHFALFNPAFERFMQIDDTWRGRPVANLTSMSFRQDGDRVHRGAVGGTALLTVRVGDSDYPNADQVFDRNWQSTPTLVFGPNRVNLPDWTALPPSTPAPWSLRVPFDQPWSFSGDFALAFELIALQVDASDGPAIDRELGAPGSFRSEVATRGADGCILPGTVLPMTHQLELRNYGPAQPLAGMRFVVGAQRAPTDQPAVVNLALTDANLVVPGLCARFHAAPIVSIGLGNTDVLGDIRPLDIDIPYVAAAEGATVVSQVASLWPASSGLPFAVSNPCTATMPPAPRPAPATAYLYAQFLTDASAPLWRDRGIIVRFDQ